MCTEEGPDPRRTVPRLRTDLADGDKKLLEHMQMYVMETKVAEADLSAEEAAIWESMKEQYLKTAEERRGGDGQ